VTAPVQQVVKKPRKPYTRKLVIGKDIDIKDIENIEQPKKAVTKKAKSKNVNFVIEE
jgi:ABC-type dipeptide/oligopeptide/nickel transport system ATPase component